MQKVILHRPATRFSRLSSLWVITFILLAISQPVLAQPIKILPIGDSWTEGVGHHVSYRYDLWFDLIDAGFDVDFVGNKRNTYDGPDLDLYPEYMTRFDRDHQAQAGIRTDMLVNAAKGAAATHEPDIVLLWAGGADLGWLGSHGVSNAYRGLRDIIAGIRKFVPEVTILLAQSPPYIGNGSDYIEDLNDVVATVASDLNTSESPIILVDHYTGYDIESMTQNDHDHQNRVGEAWIAENWFEALAKILPTFEFSINAGLNDAWYNPATDGQGFFITVFPDLGYVSLAWFTYDTELPAEDAEANLGDAGHRWITAIGPITGNQVIMNIDITSGGLFDNPLEVDHTDPTGSDGTITLTFDSCNSGTIDYDITSINRQGTVPIRRVADDNIVLCEALKAD